MIQKTYTRHKETVHNFFWHSLQLTGKQGVVFVIFFIAAKFLTPEKFGIFNYMMAVIGLLMLLCDFGLSLGISKFVTEHKARQSEKLNTILFSVSIVVIIISALISAIVVLFGSRIFGDNYKYVLYLLPYLFLMPLTGIAEGIYKGLKEFKKLSLITCIVGIFSLVVSVFLISRFYLIGAILAQNVLYLLLTVFLYTFQKTFKLRFDKAVLVQIVKYTAVLGISGVAYFLYSKVDILILKQFGFVVEIGYYEIVNKVFLLLFVPFAILGQVIAPNTTKYITVKDFTEIKNKLKKYAILCFSAGAALGILLYFAIPTLLKSFLPAYYSAAFLTIMTIMLVLLPFKVWGACSSQGFIIPAGLAKITAITTAIGGILNVILDYVFINLIGFVGVFWVTLVIHSTNICVSSLYLWWKINLLEAKR